MRIDIATLFPEMCEMVLNTSIIGRAQKDSLVTVACHNIRDYTLDKQKRVDDAPYGGGLGMVMQADPIYRCYKAVCEMTGNKPYVIYLSPQGKTLTEARSAALTKSEHLFLLCGHYEGVDERVLEKIVDEEISIGDYVLTGGELPALVLADSVIRLLPGVLRDSECFEQESHYNCLLEYPQYSRPAEWEGMKVPDVLLTGHHKNIEKWRREKSLERTLDKRPDMLASAVLREEESAYLEQYRRKKEKSNDMDE